MKPVAGPAEDNDTKLRELTESVAASLDADVILYNGPIEPPLDQQLIAASCQRRRRKNALLILVTRGGDADSAYRIARHLQVKYERFEMFVSGYCKSAGSLVALGAQELVWGDHGELGPLDVQMSKEDSLWDMRSGLTVNTALTALQDTAYLAFESFFLETEERSGGAITVKTAAEMATNLTTGLFAPLYSQIDPLHVAEAARAMKIADHYGRLLMPGSQNYNEEGLDHLIRGYPSHSFVIDRQQAESIFEEIRDPSQDEAALVKALLSFAITPHPGRGVVRYLSAEPEAQVAAPPDHQANEDEQANEVELNLKPPLITPIKDQNGKEDPDSGTAAHRTSAKPGA